MRKSGKKDQYRLDERLLSLGLALDLSDARALVMAGQVLVDEQRVDKPGFRLGSDQVVRLKEQKRFVSRGGDKLWGAIEDFNIRDLFVNATILDCGASTGGFSDCALQLGAKLVYALDIGFNQLAWKLRTDPRVVVMESQDIRLVYNIIDKNIGIVVADISFNSLESLLPSLCRAVPANGVHFLLLVKPQFELAAHEVPDGGVVVDEPRNICSCPNRPLIQLKSPKPRANTASID
ncbi:MAG: S4 domain-containing protein [Proteobacteria bacterium]|nr:S4 domain-containing protein [Pseudomonadota bacterium]